MTESRTFEGLEAWKSGRELRRKFSGFSKTLPDEEKFLLRSQILRASRSVTTNIAEGYGRFHYKENIQFCRQSRGFLMELLDHISVALDEEFLSEEMYQEFRSDLLHVIKLLNGYIAFLSKSKNEPKND